MQGPVPDQFNLVVTDMDATVALYRKLGLTIPDTDPYAVIEDPDGNTVGIMSPVDPDRRSQPDFGET